MVLRSNKKPLLQHFQMVLFVLHVILTLEYIDKILRYDHSNETSLAVLSHTFPSPLLDSLGTKRNDQPSSLSAISGATPQPCTEILSGNRSFYSSYVSFRLFVCDFLSGVSVKS